MDRLRLTLLGGFEARLPAGPAPSLPLKAQALLAYLAVRPGQNHPRDKLAALLWGDTGEAQARDSLRHTLAALRKAFEAAAGRVFIAQEQSFALDPDAIDVDVVAFERRVAEATPEALEEAVALYQGDLLEGLAVSEARFEEWLLAERERLHELALEALAKLVAHQTQAGATERAIQTAVRLLALDPLQEAVHRALMRLYARQGRRGVALKQYQVCVSVLQRELGAEPEAETKQLYQEILRRRSVEAAETSGPSGPAHAHPGRSASGAGRPAFGFAAELPVETTLVGRDAELGKLREALDEAANGHGRVVMVVGEAGIGKTSILRALAGEAVQRGGRVLLGRSYESEQILPFAPWVDAFRTGQVMSDEEVLGTLQPVWRSELARLLPEVGAPGLPPPSDDQRRLFESVARLVEHLATVQPLALLLEDLHWADEMSVRLLSFVGRQVKAWPVLLIATAREEELDEAAALRVALQELRRENHFVELPLALLSAEETAHLVRSLSRVGTDPGVMSTLEERVWHMSRGNPFVVVETLRAVGEGTTVGSGSLPLPDRVREVIAGRLERLGDQGRDLVAVAAVIGREFEFPVLHRAAGLSEHETATAMEELVRRRILHGVGERFDFTHDRIRDVAYGQLIGPRRKLLHAAVGQTLEELYSVNLEPHYAALGMHYWEGEVWEKAVTYLRRAGAQAMKRSAHRDATACFEQALVALQRLPETHQTLEQAVDIRFDLRTSYWPLGNFEVILRHLGEAEVGAAKLGDQRRLGWASVYLCANFWFIGQENKALVFGERAERIAAALDDRRLRLAASIFFGDACIAAGDHRRAVDVLRPTLDGIEDDLRRERLGLAGYPVPQTLGWLAWSLAERGDFDEAIARGREALRDAEAFDHPHTIVVSCRGLANVHGIKGELPEAIGLMERALALCHEWKLTAASLSLTGSLGHFYAVSGRIPEGLALLHQAFEATGSMAFGLFHSSITVQLSEASLLGGRNEDAKRFAALGLALANAGGQRGCEARARRLLGDIAAHDDPPALELAADHYGAALALAAELGMRPLVAHCHLGLGELYGKLGTPLEARAELTAASDLYRSMGMTFWLTRVETALAAATR